MSAACLVYVVGEGPSDIGGLAKERQYRNPQRDARGFYPPLLARIAGEERRLSFEGDRYQTILDTGVTEPDAIEGRRARLALVTGAVMHGARLVVFAMDVDREQGRRATAPEGRRQHADKIAAIREGFRLAREADPALDTVVAIAAAPLRMVECWALGDPAAIDAVGGRVQAVPAAPEALWGSKHDPDSNYPKFALARALGRAPTEGTSSEDFEKIASAMNLDTAAARCPVSFAPFLAEVRDVVARCRGPAMPANAAGDTKPGRSARSRRR